MMKSALVDSILMVGMMLCPVTIIVLLISFLWVVVVAFRQGIAQLKQLHSIPCDRCTYFTGCHYLKCTVHPCKALTEDAVNCLDFEPATSSQIGCSNRCKC